MKPGNRWFENTVFFYDLKENANERTKVQDHFERANARPEG